MIGPRSLRSANQGEVVGHGRLEGERVLLHQLHREHRGHRLADRPDLPQRIGWRIAIRADGERPLAIRDRHGERRRDAGAEQSGGEGVKP